MSNEKNLRFCSFAERYIIARAAFFRVGYEDEDAWRCLLDAKRIYRLIERSGRYLDPSVV